MVNIKKEADVHDHCLWIADYNYRPRGAVPNGLKQMNGHEVESSKSSKILTYES